MGSRPWPAARPAAGSLDGKGRSGEPRSSTAGGGSGLPATLPPNPLPPAAGSPSPVPVGPRDGDPPVASPYTPVPLGKRDPVPSAQGPAPVGPRGARPPDDGSVSAPGPHGGAPPGER